MILSHAFLIYIAKLGDERQHTYLMAKVAPGLGAKSRTLSGKDAPPQGENTHCIISLYLYAG